MERLKILRKEKGYTQTQLAKMLKTSQANLSGWERGEWEPDNDNLKKMALIFGVTVDYLIEANDNRTEKTSKTFFSTLKALRKEKEITQTELADRLFIDQTTVSKWELGKAIPDQKMLLRLAELFNVSVDYLLGRIEWTEAEKAEGIGNHAVVLSDVDRERFYTLAKAEEVLGKSYVDGVMKMLEIAIKAKENV